ncbi:MAG TPA: NAD(P)/FAD-dependent oxidoreductase [Steroidobacteraceae bacterium]|nr:NAD(P)/FAD-dependent oxidoreductase [Steroidobacteraceae bacterium]
MHNVNALRVAVAGGGIAGLASAIFLARDGHRVDVFEKSPGIVANGTGILLQPAGIDVLRRLALEPQAFERGCAIERVVTRARDGATLMNLRYTDMQPELRALGIRRPSLASLLHEAARDAGATIHFGVAIEKVDERPDRVSLNERGGRTHGPFDLALVCNGLNSRLRDGVAPGAKLRAHARGVYSVVAPLPASLSGEVLLQSLNGMRDGVGMLPIGRGDGATPLVSFFWNARASDLPALETEGYAAWCAYIEGFCPEAGELLRSFKGFEELTWSTTADVALRRWHGARTLVIGDAAHALNPQLGLGATMALLDAECLSHTLRECAAGAVYTALPAYQARRRPQIDRYARVSRFWSRLDGTGFSPLRRRMFLGLANGLPALRRRLLKHVCGYG